MTKLLALEPIGNNASVKIVMTADCAGQLAFDEGLDLPQNLFGTIRLRALHPAEARRAAEAIGVSLDFEQAHYTAADIVCRGSAQ